MNKTKHKALNKTEFKGGFFRALLFGLVGCALTWLLLSLLFAFVMSKQTDSTGMLNVLSPVVAALSLLTGGFVSGKTDKACSPLAAFVLGCAVLGICYGISSAMDLSRELSNFMKTLVVALMLIFPVIGANISTRKAKNKRYSRKRM